MRKNKGFTLVEIMIVVMIIALLVAMAIPAFERARRNSQVASLLNDMRNLEHGADQYFIERSKTAVPLSDLVGKGNFVKKLKYSVVEGNYGPASLNVGSGTMSGRSPAGYTAEYNMTRGDTGSNIPQTVF